MTGQTTSPTKTAAELRAQAAACEQEAVDSFERCDTDGFLSQWASGKMAAQYRMEAALVEAGGTHEFLALYTLDGQPTGARLVQTRYGSKFAVDTDQGTKWVDPFVRTATLTKKGYRLAYETREAYVEMIGDTYFNVRPVYKPKRDSVGVFSHWADDEDES